ERTPGVLRRSRPLFERGTSMSGTKKVTDEVPTEGALLELALCLSPEDHLAMDGTAHLILRLLHRLVGPEEQEQMARRLSTVLMAGADALGDVGAWLRCGRSLSEEGEIRREL